MVDPERFQHGIDAAQAKLRARLGARGKTLEQCLGRAGRGLPKPARLAGRRLVAAQPMIAHPRLRRLVTRAEVVAALATLNDHLDGISPSERRKDRLLGVAGSVVFNLLLLAALIIAILRWRGLA